MPSNVKAPEHKESAVRPAVRDTKGTVQNTPPVMWKSFEQFWNACIKNGDERHMVACKIHLQSLGWLDKPSKWIEGVKNFGIEVEK
jgi:hypothetical protein